MLITIKIIGKTSDGRDWYKEYHCYGYKNADEICEDCILKFQCFSGREKMEIPVADLTVKHFANIDVAVIADTITPTVKVTIREDKDGKKRAKVNFKKVRKFV